MIIIQYFFTNEEGRILPPGITVGKFKEEEIFKKGLSDKIRYKEFWRKYIKKFYKDLIREYKDEIRWKVFKFGGDKRTGRNYMVYFPGEDKFGKELDVSEYGIIV